MFSCCFFAKTKKSNITSVTTIQEVQKEKCIKKTFKISADAITRNMRELGNGGSSVVFHGIWENKEVAIKQFKDGSKSKYYHEKSIAKYFIKLGSQSNNIIQYYGCVEYGMQNSLVMEYMPQGNLADYVLGGNPPNTILSMFIACDIARGLLWLQQYHIIHCDIKLENILLNNDLCAKITDFGSSILEDKSGFIVEMIGTPGYIAPEILSATGYMPYTFSSDIYAFGVTLLEMINSESAYDNDRLTQSIYDEIITGKRPDISSKCPEGITKVINSMWNENPKLRPNINNLVDNLETIRNTMKM